MALKDLKSLYDRHTRLDNYTSVAGPNGEGPTPSHGAYYSNNMESDSPFNTIRGPKMDQMVKMLTSTVSSGNSGLTYQPSPLNGLDFQDLNGGFAPANSTLGQFGGPYEGNFPG